jgi:hypothetical protein
MRTTGRPKRHTTARALLLAAAAASFALSVILYFGGDETEGIFVGIWVPSILALGAFLAPRECEPRSPAGSEERER